MIPPELVESALKGLNVDDITVQRIMQILKEGYEGIDAQKVGETSSTGFGPSTRGGVLDYNTSRARAHVVQAMDDMVLGLQEYRRGMQSWRTALDDSDRDSKTAFTRIQNASSCTDEPIQGPSQCTVPTEGS